MIPSNVTRGVRMIKQFDGRDSPEQFWSYATAVVVAAFVPAFALNAVVVALTVLISRDAVTPVLPSIILIGTAVLATAVAALLASAVTRRLHDRSHSGWWALPPFVLLLAGMGLMAPLFTSVDQPPEPAPAFLIPMFAVIIVYFIALGLLVLQLALPGKSATGTVGSA